MRIKLAETAGFCFGVDRAVNMAYDLADKGCKAVTLGQLIHNPTVTEDLESKGMRVVENPCDVIEGETVVIRAHGVKKSVDTELENMGASVCDATCPFVKKSTTLLRKIRQRIFPLLSAATRIIPRLSV